MKVIVFRNAVCQKHAETRELFESPVVIFSDTEGFMPVRQQKACGCISWNCRDIGNGMMLTPTMEQTRQALGWDQERMPAPGEIEVGVWSNGGRKN